MNNINMEWPARFASLEMQVSSHANLIQEMKEEHREFEKETREFRNMLYEKIDSIKSSIGKLAINNQSVTVSNQKKINSMLIAFIGQILVGVILIYLSLVVKR